MILVLCLIYIRLNINILAMMLVFLLKYNYINYRYFNNDVSIFY